MVGLLVSIKGKRSKNYLWSYNIYIVSSSIDIVYPNKYLSLQSSGIDIVRSNLYIIYSNEYLSIRRSDINIVYPNKHLSIWISNIFTVSPDIDIVHRKKIPVHMKLQYRHHKLQYWYRVNILNCRYSRIT